MNKSAKLSVEDLHLSYGTFDVLKGITFDLKQGEVLALLGPSGSGKTTLLRAVAGLEKPRSGRVAIDNTTVFDSARKLEMPVEKRDLGMVFQSYALWPHKTVNENVAYGMKLRGTDRAKTRQAVQDALDQLGLGELGTRYPHELSGGQQQRVAIARALVYSPPVILMDEPLSNLDANLREEAKTWLRSMITQMNLSAIIVTHDQQEAMAIGDRIIFLSGGRIEQSAPPIQIYNDPASYVAAEFFGRNNRVYGACKARDGDHIILEGSFGTLAGTGREPLSPGDRCGAILRIERTRLVSASAENTIRGEHVTSMYAGAHWEHVFRCGELLISAQSNRPVEGVEHWISVDPSDLWIYRASS